MSHIHISMTRTDTFNDFLWNILKYYQSFLNQKEASEDEAVDIPGWTNTAQY